MKKVLSVLLALVLAFVLLPMNVEAATVASGTCGEDLTWVLDDQGTLTISGTGKMEDYIQENPAPWWWDYRETVKKAVIADGVTSIGNFAFWMCESVISVDVPDSVTEIGIAAFEECFELEHVMIPDGVTVIKDSTFKECFSLQDITIPNSVTTIEAHAFSRCDSLTDITIPDSVTFIGTGAFSVCSSLVGIHVSENNPAYSSDEFGVLFNKKKTTLIQAPAAIAGHYTIPSSVATIEELSFMCCIELNGVTIQENVTKIGICAFVFCEKLTDITFTGNAPTMDEGVFESVTATAHYPSGNTTWTADVMQNYGGTITWVSYTPLKITTQPASVTVAPTGKAAFTVAATGTNLTYQWQYRANSSAAWTNNTCKSATLNFNPAAAWRNGYQYRCVVTDALGNKAYSNVATLTVKEGIKITKQPASVTVAPTGKATFTVAATGTNLTYQWQFRANSSAAWVNNTCKTATLTFNPAAAWRNGYQYRCVITDGNGNKAYSNAATLTVKAPITITKQPASITVAPTGKASFTVAATGTGLTYQWQFRANSSAAWVNNTCKTATLTFNPAAAWRNGYQYRCVITDGSGNKAYSNAVTLTVKAPITITKQPASLTVAPTGKATFSVAATGTNLTYQWQFRANSSAAWTNNTCKTATLTFNPVAAWRNGYQYRCVITDANGNTVYTNAVTLTVK